jgi:HPr kinase/phosphorylase
VRIFLQHHVTWSVNSVCHFFGKRRFDVEDQSTNVFWLAIPSFGESWHHNHHAFPRSAAHGLKWWEIDPSAIVINLMRRDIPVFILTKGLEPVPEFERLVEPRGIPVLRSPSLSSTVIKRVSFFLEEHLVPSVHLHGVLLDIYGLGVLLIGSSGVGKSECALDLITRGHSLVADDRVTVKLYPSGDLVGSSDKPLRHHMELRGLGIVNVHDLFGLASVREHKPIDLVVELEKWDETKAYDRLGLDETVYPILDTPCPYIKMPVALGRNLSILVEIAARNHLLKMQGHHSAREFARKLEERLAEGARE